MQIIKRKIKYTDKDINLSFMPTSNNDVYGSQENIDRFVNEKTNEIIGVPIDNDTVAFKRNDNYTFTFSFQYNSIVFVKNLLPIGFTQKMITNQTTQIYKSFYMFEFFNDYNLSNRVKLTTSYLPLLFLRNYGVYTEYNDLNEFSLSDIHINNENIEKLTYDENNITTLYCRISFYNPILGKFHIFTNEVNNENYGDLVEMFLVKLNKNTMSYEFLYDISGIENSNIDYVTNMNKTISNIDLSKPIYPNGTSFDDGNYT